MGFMGLNHWVESDNAADFRYVLIQNMLEECKKEVVHETNEYNTDGCINIALLLEDGTFDFLEEYDFEKFGPVFDEAIERLDKKIDDYKAFLSEIDQSAGWTMDDMEQFYEQMQDIERLRDSTLSFLEKKNAKEFYSYEEMEIINEEVD